MVDLPDFNTMVERIDKIRELMFKQLKLQAEIKDEESRVTRRAVMNSKYFVSGKVPSMSYIEKAYIPSGFDGTLLAMRESLAEVTSDLEHQKNLLDLDKSLIEIWRTQSANERKATL